MKFALVCPYDLSIPGGVGEIVLEKHQQLSKYGHRSKIITVETRKPLRLSGVKYFGKSIPIEANKTSAVIDIENIESDHKLHDLLDKEKFDIICVHEPEAPFLNWQVLKYSKAINIGWFHSTASIDFDSFPYNVLMQPLEFWLASKLHGLIAVSPSAKNTWKGFFEKRGVIIPGGVNTERFSQAKKIGLSQLPKILFVGRLDKRKGVDHAIKAFNYLINDLKFEAQLYIVGDGPMREEAEKLVSGFGLRGLVEFTGRVSKNDLPGYYKSCDVYVAPSTMGESLGIVLLEAMAAGIPVIAYANSGYKFTLKGSPWSRSLVKVGDYEGLAKAAAVLLKEKRVVNKLLRWQGKRIKYFSWDNVMKMFLDYVEEVRSRHLLN